MWQPGDHSGGQQHRAARLLRLPHAPQQQTVGIVLRLEGGVGALGTEAETAVLPAECRRPLHALQLLEQQSARPGRRLALLGHPVPLQLDVLPVERRGAVRTGGGQRHRRPRQQIAVARGVGHLLQQQGVAHLLDEVLGHTGAVLVHRQLIRVRGVRQPSAGHLGEGVGAVAQPQTESAALAPAGLIGDARHRAQRHGDLSQGLAQLMHLTLGAGHDPDGLPVEGPRPGPLEDFRHAPII